MFLLCWYVVLLILLIVVAVVTVVERQGQQQQAQGGSLWSRVRVRAARRELGGGESGEWVCMHGGIGTIRETGAWYQRLSLFKGSSMKDMATECEHAGQVQYSIHMHMQTTHRQPDTTTDTSIHACMKEKKNRPFLIGKIFVQWFKKMV